MSIDIAQVLASEHSSKLDSLPAKERQDLESALQKATRLIQSLHAVTELDARARQLPASKLTIIESQVKTALVKAYSQGGNSAAQSQQLFARYRNDPVSLRAAYNAAETLYRANAETASPLAKGSDFAKRLADAAEKGGIVIRNGFEKVVEDGGLLQKFRGESPDTMLREQQ